MHMHFPMSVPMRMQQTMTTTMKHHQHRHRSMKAAGIGVRSLPTILLASMRLLSLLPSYASALSYSTEGNSFGEASSYSTSHSYRTVQVQVVHRHGDRTPITPLKNEEYWKNQLVPEDLLERVATGTKVLRNNNGSNNSSDNDNKGKNHLEIHAAAGKGPFGKLTKLGLLGMIQVGTTLKEELEESTKWAESTNAASSTIAITTQQQQQQQQQHAPHTANVVSTHGITSSSSRVIAVVLLVVHLIRRAYECAFVQQHAKESSKMHIAGYALGLGYYLVLPFVFWDVDANAARIPTSSNSNSAQNSCLAFEEILVSKTTAATTTSNNSIYNDKTYSEIVGVLGMTMICVNLWLQYEQHAHHDILAGLRRNAVAKTKLGHDDCDCNDVNSNPKNNNSSSGDNDCKRKLPNTREQYSLPPYRRWFRYVLSPHYLAEILLYLSFAVLLETSVVAEGVPTVVPNEFVCANSNSQNHDIQHTASGYVLWFGKTLLPLLSVGRKNRHWMLFLWVATNLTVSALNSYDWYHSRLYTSNHANNANDNVANEQNHTCGPLAPGKNRDPRKVLVPMLL